MAKISEQVLSLDLRSLALFRIVVGLLTTGDILHRLVDLRKLYMDAGALPRSAVTGEFANHWVFSLHLVSDAMWWQLLLFGLSALAGLAMAAGYRTWVATFICWVLTVSLHNRNEAALDGADVVHRLMLFWAMFLPLGAIWSVDRVRSGVAAARSYVFTSGSVALTIQMFCIFFCAALLKTGDPWRKDFTAVWYVLNWDVFATSTAVWLRPFHGLLQFFTVVALIVEGIGPLLLFVPWAPLRTVVLLVFISMHASFVLVLKLFQFASIMIAGWVALLPGWFWDKLGVPLEMNEVWRRRFERLSNALPGHRGGPALPERWARGFAMMAMLCLIYVACWNIRSVLPSFGLAFPQRVNPFAFTLRLDQYWTMFAPVPIAEDGWYVVPGRLADGRVVDVYRDGAPLTWERPALIADTYANRRWRRYLWTATQADSAAYRKYYAAFLCREWERNHDEVLNIFDIVLMLEKSQPDYTVTKPEKLVLYEGYKCH